MAEERIGKNQKWVLIHCYRKSILHTLREYKQRSQQIVVICIPSALKRDFDWIRMCGTLGGIGSNRELPVQFHYIFGSLKSVPRSRVTQALPSYRLLDDGAMHLHRVLRSDPETDIFVHVISGIQSQTEFADALRSIFARYNLE